jgi:hypothetical protein
VHRHTMKAGPWVVSMDQQGCQMVYFETKKPNLGQILGGLALEDVGTLYGHLVHFTSIRYIWWSFGIFFPLFGMLYQEKSGNPGRDLASEIKFCVCNVRMPKVATTRFCLFFALQNCDPEILINRDRDLRPSLVAKLGRNRVARLFLTQFTKTGENVPNCH